MKRAKSQLASLALPAFSLALVLASCGGEVAQSAEGGPCARKAPGDFPAGEVTEIEDGDPPCRIVFRKTGVRLEAVADGSRPDPGLTVAMDGEGRFYSTNARGFQSVISVWDPGGGYLKSFARVGEGPGELSGRGMLTIYMDDEDQLHVRDGGFSWSVFSRDQEFLRRVAIQVPGGLSDERSTIILDDGRALLSNDGHYSDRTRHFFLMDSAGALSRTFGPVKEELSRSRRSMQRIVSHEGGDTFWAGPAEGSEEGYVLEEWGTDGELRRAFRRVPSWYEWSGDDELWMGPIVHVGDGGLLLVMVWMPTEELREYLQGRDDRYDDDEDERMFTELSKFGFEMIDTRSGELLASERWEGEKFWEMAPHTFFRGVQRGYRYTEDGPGGLPFVDMVAVELEAK